MTDQHDVKPPRLARAFLEWYCRAELFEDLEGDLHEYFERNIKSKGLRQARMTYWLDVLKFIRSYTIRRPLFIHHIIQLIMIKSYIKTSGRNIVRNKLFSGINIFGLAISMSVGLLLITFILQLKSFDRFHEKKDRTFRVITATGGMEAATTSVLAGKKIRETIPGVEDVTIVRRGFHGDAKVGVNTIPLGGFWADNSFLSVFTFPLIHGDQATALREPYSIIVTEKTAGKLFGKTDVVGKAIVFDTTNYVITGVMKDIPAQSHLNFDALASFSTVEILQPDTDGGFMNWGSCFMNLVYITVPTTANINSVQAGLDKICKSENAVSKFEIHLSLQPLTNIVLGKRLVNQEGPVMNTTAILVLAGLALIVIISACFNYTNLSMARSLRRSKEVGVRKVVGASKRNVLGQFLTESLIISLMSLCFAFVLFLALREQFLSLHPFLSAFGSLPLTPAVVLWFVGLAFMVAVLAGALPAVFFSRIDAAQVLKDISSLRVFRRVNLRKGLVVVQFAFSLMFITATVIGYTQYKNFLTTDLGFSTTDIVNVNLKGNKATLLTKEFRELPDVKNISTSMIVMSLGNIMGGNVKYEKTGDSSAIWQNFVDEHYLSLHEYTLLAGKDFASRAEGSEENETIVNEKLLHRFNISPNKPDDAVGEEILIDGKHLTIVGVVKDFHYETLEDGIEPTLFRHTLNPSFGYINLKVSTTDWPATFAALEKAWKKVDPIHPLQASFYNDQLEHAYSVYVMMIKVIGFLAFLAICISSLGLFGMVVFTTETRLKEISIRKVLGAGDITLVYLLSKGFVTLILVAAAFAIPVTYLFFDRVILSNIAFHQPIGLIEIAISLAVVTGIAGLMIGAQTFKAVRTNPAGVLRNE